MNDKYKVILIWDGTNDAIDFIADSLDKALGIAKFLLNQGYEVKIFHILDDDD